MTTSRPSSPLPRETLNNQALGLNGVSLPSCRYSPRAVPSLDRDYSRVKRITTPSFGLSTPQKQIETYTKQKSTMVTPIGLPLARIQLERHTRLNEVFPIRKCSTVNLHPNRPFSLVCQTSPAFLEECLNKYWPIPLRKKLYLIFHLL